MTATMTTSMRGSLRAGGQGADQQDDFREKTVHFRLLTEQPRCRGYFYKTAGTEACKARLSKGFVSADQR